MKFQIDRKCKLFSIRWNRIAVSVMMLIINIFYLNSYPSEMYSPKPILV